MIEILVYCVLALATFIAILSIWSSLENIDYINKEMRSLDYENLAAEKEEVIRMTMEEFKKHFPEEYAESFPEKEEKTS